MINMFIEIRGTCRPRYDTDATAGDTERNQQPLKMFRPMWL